VRAHRSYRYDSRVLRGSHGGAFKYCRSGPSGSAWTGSRVGRRGGDLATEPARGHGRGRWMRDPAEYAADIWVLGGVERIGSARGRRATSVRRPAATLFISLCLSRAMD
jgi:hypothetical protein